MFKSNLLFILFSFIVIIPILGQFEEVRPVLQKQDNPEWVKYLYEETPNIYKIEKAYKDYYSTHKFEKNENTRFYKRWKRKAYMIADDLGNVKKPTTLEIQKRQRQIVKDYYGNQANKNQTMVNSVWEEYGPWEYDHINLKGGTAGLGNMVEAFQAPSNREIVYVSSVSNGLWKSSDRGKNYTHVLRDLGVENFKRTIALDPQNSDILFFAVGGEIYKSTDGCNTYHSLNSNNLILENIILIRIHPSDSNKLLIGTERTIYWSNDGGITFSESILKNSNFQGKVNEIKFKPDNPDIIYAGIEYTGSNGIRRTRFVKSIDGGSTFTVKNKGWAGVVSSTIDTLIALEFNEATASLNSSLKLGGATIEDFTIEMKIRTFPNSANSIILGNKTTLSNAKDKQKGIMFFQNNSNNIWNFNIGDGTNHLRFAGSNIEDDKWHHIAISYDKDGTKFVFQNGETINSTVSILAGDPTNMNELILGAASDLSDKFYGDIAYLKIWNKALTENELVLSNNIDINNHPQSSFLLHHYKIQENQGNILFDSKGNLDLDITGNPLWINEPELIEIEAYNLPVRMNKVRFDVTSADPNLIYAIIPQSGMETGSGLYSILKSEDAGESFHQVCCGTEGAGIYGLNNPNIIGYASDFSTAGGQVFYNSTIVVSELDPNKVYVGGISLARSFDGGASWEMYARWNGGGGNGSGSGGANGRYSHADSRELNINKYNNDEDVWFCSDGGTYYTTGEQDFIEPRLYGIQGIQFRGFDASYKTDRMGGGAYHNGYIHKQQDFFPKGKNGHSGWRGEGSGDGSYGQIHDGHPNRLGTGSKTFQQYVDKNNKVRYNWSPGNQLEVEQNLEWDPRFTSHAYFSSGSKLFKTEDDGNSHQMVYDFTTGSLGKIKISNDSPNTIYVVHYNLALNKSNILKSVNSGATWTDITPSGAVDNNRKVIDVDQQNANRIWVLNKNKTGQKFYYSNDGGISWSALPNTGIENNKLRDFAYQQGSDNGALYLGGNTTMYYFNTEINTWITFNNNLPVFIQPHWVRPNYTKGKIRIGTWGQGVYQADFNTPSTPISKFSVESNIVTCHRTPVQFRDLSYSSDINKTYSWSFPGGTPSTSNVENPTVYYNTNGTFSATLTISDIHGTHTYTHHDFIQVNSTCSDIGSKGNKAVFDGTKNTHIRKYYNLPAQTSVIPSDDFSITTWVKLSSDQINKFHILGNRKFNYSNNSVTGILLGGDNGQIILHVSQNNFGRKIKSIKNTYFDDKWHYIAVTFEKGLEAKLYIDGELQSVLDISSFSTFNSKLGFSIGSDIDGDKSMTGEIEELKIWEKALSQDEIRERRHLIESVNTPFLAHYYQFNDTNTFVYDAIGGEQLLFAGSMQYKVSDAPLGEGVSDRHTILNGGAYSFENAGLKIVFPENSTYPDGELTVSRINTHPNVLPNGNYHLDYYWIVNNYGENQNFTTIDSIIFTPNPENINPEFLANPEKLMLHKREDNEHLNNWSTQCNASTVTNGVNGSFGFDSSCMIDHFSQFQISANTAFLPVELKTFELEKHEKHQTKLKWSTAIEINFSHFEIEHSIDGLHFSSIGTVQPIGKDFRTKAYDFIHKFTVHGLNYYRLKMIDLNEDFEYSEIKTIRHEFLTKTSLYPNPNAIGNTITLNSDEESILKATLYDISGKKVVEETFYKKGFLETRNLKAGIYVCEILNGKSKESIKVVLTD